MSKHSYSRCWLHLIWATLNREPMLSKSLAVKASGWLSEYSLEKGIYMKINYFNADHVHALIDLPTNKTTEEVAQLFKGSMSHRINEEKVLRGTFAWGRGYGAFSVSHSDVSRVAKYIAEQEEHHKTKTYSEEYQLFVTKYGMEWRGD
ncbi:MAG TPA: IS200/IS605 family transposase [Pyrinomonadaceae bacterium]|nr:IS200/IS605 family transposase [Pyrinomonadaceae bacterium]